jgi:hypothetical protein
VSSAFGSNLTAGTDVVAALVARVASTLTDGAEVLASSTDDDVSLGPPAAWLELFTPDVTGFNGPSFDLPS